MPGTALKSHPSSDSFLWDSAYSLKNSSSSCHPQTRTNLPRQLHKTPTAHPPGRTLTAAYASTYLRKEGSVTRALSVGSWSRPSLSPFRSSLPPIKTHRGQEPRAENREPGTLEWRVQYRCSTWVDSQQHIRREGWRCRTQSNRWRTSRERWSTPPRTLTSPCGTSPATTPGSLESEGHGGDSRSIL